MAALGHFPTLLELNILCPFMTLFGSHASVRTPASSRFLASLNSALPDFRVMSGEQTTLEAEFLFGKLVLPKLLLLR